MDLEKFKKLFELNEGRRNKMYKCSAGFNTIGVGHNLDTRPISDRAIDVILEDDIAEDMHGMIAAFPWILEHDEVRQAALLDLYLNMGVGTLSTFKNTLAAFKAKDYEGAAQGLESSKWFNQVGYRGPRVVGMVRHGEWPAGI